MKIFLMLSLNSYGIILFLMASSVICDRDEVKKVFMQHGVVPDVISTAPKEFLKVCYDGNLLASKGVELTPTQVKYAPTVMWGAAPHALYTLLMVDPDAPSRANNSLGEIKHWLVVNIPGNALGDGDIIAGYRGSGPPKDTGLHRYIFLLYEQSIRLQVDETPVPSSSRKDRIKFSTRNFVEKYELGTPVAGNFYQAQWDGYADIARESGTD